MAQTQRQTDAATLRSLASDYGLDCTITTTPTGYAITMETGEVEPAVTVEYACEIIRAYGRIAQSAEVR